jgi:ribonuclease P protein component
MSARLGRDERLRRKKDFERVLFRGKRLKQAPVAIYYAPNPDSGRRAAFIAAGRFRNAVARNRVRRRLREIFRINQDQFASGFDFILRGDPPAAELEFSALRSTILDLARKVAPIEE